MVIVKTIIIVAAGSVWLLASGIARKANGVEKIVLAVSLGLACAMLAGALSIVAGLAFDIVGNCILFPLAIAQVGTWLFGKPKLIHLKTKVNELSRYWLPGALFSFHLVLWAIYLINYPYFPNSLPIDVVWHSDVTSSVLRRDIAGPMAEAGFPTGSHILFAFVSAYLGIDVLSSVRVTSAAVEAMSVLVAYCLFQRFLPTRQSAGYATVAFSLVIPAGLVYYARVGAYPNIIGDFLALASLLLALIISEKLTLRSVLTAALVQSTALMSHISVAVLAALVICFSVAVFRRFRSQFRVYLISNVGFFAFPMVALATAPSLLFREFAYVLTYYLELNNNLGLILRQWLHNYLFLAGSLNFILLMAAFGWVVMKREKRIWSMFLATWFGLLFLLVFVSTNDWRLVLLSLVPGAGLLGLLLSRVQEALEKVTVRRILTARLRQICVNLMMLAIVIVLTAGGPAVFAMNEALASGQASRQAHIYESMVWLQANSPPDSVVISVHLQKEYRYLPVVAKRSYRGDYELNSDGILKLRGNFQFDYVTVSTDFTGFETFYDVFRAAYRNQAVAIFEVPAVC